LTAITENVTFESLQDTIQQNMTSEGAMIHVEHRLERYQDQQDAEFATAMREPKEAAGGARLLHDARNYLTREIGRIEMHLANNETDQFVTVEAWRERLADCKSELARVERLLQREKLIDEQAAIQGTIDLHCRGLIECNMRVLEIESELKQMEVR